MKYKIKTNFTLYNNYSKFENLISKNNISNVQDGIILNRKATKLKNEKKCSEMKEEIKFQIYRKNGLYDESKIDQKIPNSTKNICKINEKNDKSMSNKTVKIRPKNYNMSNIYDNKIICNNNKTNNYIVNIGRSPMINHHNFNDPISLIQIVIYESLGLNLNNNIIMGKRKIINKKKLKMIIYIPMLKNLQ